MKPSFLLAATAAALALAGCKKSGEPGSAPAADDSGIKITQSSPPPGGTWTDVVNQTRAGYVAGDPNAKVKLVEIGSLSCPHCKAFADEGVKPLIDGYVKTGKVSWEFRPYVIHGAVDMANNLLVRCNGGKTFFPLVEAMYKDQDAFMAKAQAVPKDKLEATQNLPTNQVFVAMANLLGMQDWAAVRGVPQQKVNQCLADQKAIDNEVQLTSDVQTQFPDFAGTPAFVINGTMAPQDVTHWAKLKPLLDEAVK